MNTKLIILDRDGVINYDSDDYIKTLDEWVPLPNSIEAIARLSKAGYTIVVATNQSGLSRNFFTEQTLHLMHSNMCQLVSKLGGTITGIFYCPHHPNDLCSCRKPNTGLLDQIEKTLNCSTKDAWFIGDSVKDIELAIIKGCKPILVLTGKGSQSKIDLPEKTLNLTLVLDDLWSATNHILKVTQHDV